MNFFAVERHKKPKIATIDDSLILADTGSA
jgi:hypothetical protein